MFNKKIAQAQIISAVLILGITVGVVSAAYMWGVPLIQKSQSSARITAAENLMGDIEKAINRIVQTGGQTSVTLILDGEMEISDEKNSIIYTIKTKGANIASEWIPLNDDNMFGVSGTAQSESTAIIGQDKAGVLIAKAEPVEDEYETTYRLAYRELGDLESQRGYLVDIEIVGNNIALGGSHNLIVRKSESITKDKSALGGSLTVTQVELTIS